MAVILGREFRIPRLFVALASMAISLSAPTCVAATEIGASIPVRGVFRPLHESAIATELTARIASLPFRESERFHKGDLLVEFECDKHRAELKGATAEYRSHKIAYENSRSLQNLHAAGGLDVALAEALADKAAAAVEANEALVRQCSIVAPYDGRIVDLLAHEHDMSTPNVPLMRIVDDRNLEIDLIITSSALRWVRDGTPFTFRIDEPGATVPARVLRIGAAVDPVSQTVKLAGQLTSGADGILPGMSGTAAFDLPGE